MADSSNAGWARAGALLGGVILTVLSSHLDLQSRIDSGKDQQAQHWKQERAYKDSVDKDFRDTVLAILRKHTKGK